MLELACDGDSSGLADPLDPLEVSEEENVQEFGAGSRPEGVQSLA